MEWNVGEVRDTLEDWNGFDYITTSSCRISHFELLFLEHAGFIEEVEKTFEDTINEFIPEELRLQTVKIGEAPKRWRAEKHGYYFYLDDTFRVNEEKDTHSIFDDDLYRAGNYFQTTKQVVGFQKGVKALVGSK